MSAECQNLQYLLTVFSTVITANSSDKRNQMFFQMLE